MTRYVGVGIFFSSCLFFSLSSYEGTAQAASHDDGGVGGFIHEVIARGKAVFSSSSSTDHKHVVHHHRKHHVVSSARHAAPLPLGWGVPEGVIGAGDLALSAGALRLVEWDGQTKTLQAGSLAKPPAWASVLVNGSQMAQACSGGWVRPLDGVTSCGVQGGYEDIVLAWDRSRLPSAPLWSAFWDVARQPGRRGLYLGARTTLEIALLADGVAPDNVYAQLATPQGVDRAFRRLDVLRPYIVWWRTGEDAARIMLQSRALMTSAPASEISSVGRYVASGTIGSTFVAGTDEVLRIPVFWVIPSTVPEIDARQTLEQLRVRSPQLHPTQALAPNATPLTVSEAFWTANGESLESRFQRWYHGATP